MSLPTKFWIGLVANILSIISSFFAIFFLLFDRILRRALHNHLTIVLLFIVFIRSLSILIINVYINFFGSTAWNPLLYYLLTFFFDYGLYATQIVFVVWTTIERHLLIFHDQLLRNKQKRFFVHYLPIIVLLIYCLTYFSLITFGPFCETSVESIVDETIVNPCTLDTAFLGIWDLVLHHVIATMIIILFSLTLVIRVIKQKQRLNQPMQWRKHRKLTIQTLFTSIFYLICDAPWTMIIFALKNGLSYEIVATPLENAFILRDYVVYLYPLICFISSSELRHKLKRMILCWRHRQLVVPNGIIKENPQELNILYTQNKH